ncbi:hypothetical protein GCM10028828_13830 [Corynebacterium tapiri]
MVIVALIRVLVAASGWFYMDDLVLLAQARDSDLGTLLWQVRDGHLMPGAWLVIWLWAQLSEGLTWPAAAVALGLGNLLLCASVGYAFWRIAPTRAWWLVPVVLLNPVTLPAATWAAAAVQAIPLLALAAIWCAHAWNAQHPRDLFVVAAAIGLAGAFSERVIILAPFTLIFLAVVRRISPWLVCAVLVPSTAWAVVYMLVAGNPIHASLTTFGDFLRTGYLDSFVPALAGGPVLWERWHPGPPLATPPIVLLLAGFIVVGLLLYRRVVPTIVALAYPALVFLLLAIARSGPNTAPEITQTLRHFPEVALLVGLSLAAPAARQIPRGLGKGLVAAVLLVSLTSIVNYARAWSDQPARDYFAAFNNSEEQVLDQAVSFQVLLPITHPYNRLSTLVPDRVSPDVEKPYLVGPDGALVPATLIPARSTAAQPGCVEGSRTIALDGPLMNVEWTLRLNYLADAEGQLTIELEGGEPVIIPVHEGLHQTHVRLRGGGATLTLNSPDTKVCLGQSEVGTLVTASAA